MDLDRLSEFLIVKQEGSFRKAAARLGVAPNVLSNRMHAFENALGTRLFLPGLRQLELTGSGEMLAARAQDILDSYGNILSSMKAINNASFRSVRIMLGAQILAPNLLPFLEQYCRKYPRLFLGLYDENSCRIEDGLKSGEIDLAFAIGREDDFSGISGRIPISFYPKIKIHVPDDHPLAGKSDIRFCDLADETFILYPPMKEPHTRNLQLSILRQAGISFHVYEEDYSPFFYHLLVPVGKGLRLWNWTNETASGSTLLTIQDPGYETILYLLYQEDSENAAALRLIRDFLEFRKERF